MARRNSEHDLKKKKSFGQSKCKFLTLLWITIKIWISPEY